MSFKDKIANYVIVHPKLVTFGIGLAITFSITMVVGMVDNHQMTFDAFARQSINQHNSANQT
jgi:hypothetical protein